VTRLSINDLLASGLVDPGAHLDAERVAHYAHTPAGVPPVVVYDTPQGRLLVDGYHRIAAAQQRGASTIEAEIRHGSRRDALHYAAAKAAVQRDMSVDEAVDHIKRRSGDRWGGR
jgi:ParB-like nuclease domain